MILSRILLKWVIPVIHISGDNNHHRHINMIHGSFWNGLKISLFQVPNSFPGSKVHGANMGPTWGRQDPGGPHIGPVNFAVWEFAY